LTAITAEIPFLEESKAENTIPEKNIGHVRTVTVSNFPKVVEGKPPLLAMTQPSARLLNKKRKGISNRRTRKRWTTS